MSELETRLERRARRAYAQAVAKRAEAYESDASERRRHTLSRKEGAMRRAYVQALRAADAWEF